MPHCYAFEETDSSSSWSQLLIKSENLPSFNTNELLVLPQSSKDMIIKTLEGSNVSNIQDIHIPTCASCCMSVSFTTEGLMLGSKLHNRPLFVLGYIREQKVGQILIDDGSTTNIMPKTTMT